MKTQSPDTNIESERVLVEIIRRAPVSKRFKLVQSMTQSTFLANMHAWRESHPEASEVDTATHFVAMSYGPRLAECFQSALISCRDWHLQPVCLLVVVDEIIQKLRELDISWYLGGSIASSMYGMQQLAQDIDLVIDFPPQKIASLEAFIASLKPRFAFDEQALHQHTTISLLHMDTVMKIDLIVGKREMPFLSQAKEMCMMELDEHHQEVPVASAYEMILFKLYRYYLNELSRQDGMTNDVEWNDILGMLKVQGPSLDLPLLEQEVRHLSLEHIWELVLIDAELRKD